jgi:cytochrome c2
VKENERGEKLSHTCNTCHDIVAQGPSEDVARVENSIAGLEFKHPEDVGDAWKESKCTECHTSESGY